MTKSRLEVPSSEFGVVAAKPSSAATMSRSIGQLTPARAPEPSGITLEEPAAKAKRRTSRESIQK